MNTTLLSADSNPILLCFFQMDVAPIGSSLYAPYICSQCYKPFATEAEYKEHMSHHHSYRCPECRKELKTALGFQMHMDSHKGVQLYRYTCEYCRKGFKSKTTLKEHLTTHTNEKYFMCKECGEEFRYHFKLRKHKQQVHHLNTTER